MRPSIRLFILVVVPLLWAACSSFDNEAQQQFENEAFLRQPDGYTRVSESGEVGQRDADDWRTAPAFAARASVIVPTAPNPAPRSATVRVQMETQGVPGGLAIYTLNARGDLILLDERPDATASGFYELAFFGSQATAGGDEGLYRLIVLDGSQRVVTYGDLLVQG